MKATTILLLLGSIIPCSVAHFSPTNALTIPRGGVFPRRGIFRRGAKSTLPPPSPPSPPPPPPPVKVEPVADKTSVLGLPKRKTRFERFAEKIFEDADENHDGSVSFSEAYTLVLKMYVNLNRQAPIPPPSRKRVLQLYLNSDLSNDNKLDKEEFTHLARIVGSRALWRVTAHKLIKIVGAPLLTEFLIRKLAGKEWLKNLASFLVPERFHERILPILTSTSFWRPALLILLVISLGNIVLSIVNWILDMSLPDADEDPRVAAFKE